ncbi:MAG: MBL fold metallo-hydrolase [Planctomycetota bacterium]
MRSTLLFGIGVISLSAFFASREFITIAPLQDFKNVEIKTIKANGNIYMLEGAGGNIGISAGDDGVLMIDDQFADLEPKIREAIKKLSGKPIKFLLNTHFHGDHTGGNALFGTESSILAHTNVRKRLETGRAPMAKSGLPIITFDESLSVHFNGEEIKAIHIPNSHTDGDAVIYFTKSNVVHMGDLFFSGRFPFIDIGSGGSVKGLIAGIEKVIQTIPADAKVIPGHGPLGGVDDLKSYLKFLQRTYEIVANGVKAGKDFETLKKEDVLKEFEKFNWEFINSERFLKTLFDDIKKNK